MDVDYLPAVYFPLLYFGYKLYGKTKIVDPYHMDCESRSSHIHIWLIWVFVLQVISDVADVEATIVERPPTNTIVGRLQAMFL